MRAGLMLSPKSALSQLLFAAGITLVFTGISAALGFSPPGIVASAAVILALLYAGAVWFGADAHSRAVIVFDRSLRIASGPHLGEKVAARFPSPLRDEIEHRCTAALRGEHVRFVCEDRGRLRAFDAAPVISGHGSPIAGVLVEGAPAPVSAVPAQAIATAV